MTITTVGRCKHNATVNRIALRVAVGNSMPKRGHGWPKLPRLEKQLIQAHRTWCISCRTTLELWMLYWLVVCDTSYFSIIYRESCEQLTHIVQRGSLKPPTRYPAWVKLNDFNEMTVPAALTQLLKLTNVGSSLCLASYVLSLLTLPWVFALPWYSVTSYLACVYQCLPCFHDHMIFRFIMFLVGRTYAEEVGERRERKLKG